MATSGSVDFQHTRSQITEHALRICGVLREGLSASSDQLTTGAIAQNTVIKSLMTIGLPLWCIDKGAIFPIHNVSSVLLGPSAGHAATSWVHTTLTASSAANDTTLTVDSITGISASDVIGIELDNGNIDWTTVNGAPSGSTVTITTGVTTAASSGNHVYTYTTKIVKPVKIVKAMRYDYTDDTEIEMNQLSRDEYTRLSDKTVESSAQTDFWFEPSSQTTARFNFYPRFADGNSIIQIWFHTPFEDMDGASDTLDFPQEWEGVIVWNVAAALAFEYGVPHRKRQLIIQMAEKLRSEASDFGQEEGSVYFMADRR